MRAKTLGTRKNLLGSNATLLPRFFCLCSHWGCLSHKLVRSVGSGRCWFVYELIHPPTIDTLVTGMALVASLVADCIWCCWCYCYWCILPARKAAVVASLGGDSMPQVQDLQTDSQSQTTLCTKRTCTWTICEELGWKWGKWLFLTFPVSKQSLSPRPLYVQNALTKLELCVNLDCPLLTSFIIWLYQICITFYNLVCGWNRWVKLT